MNIKIIILHIHPIHMATYPISFSVPTEQFQKVKASLVLVEKTRIMSPLIPGDTSTYIYETEESYYHQYKESYFATTMKKGGWDCMRHYEIVMCGCLPYFIDIEQCPENTMSLWDKQMLLEANALYRDVFSTKSLDALTSEDIAT
jgi:hypothetical protein